MRVLIDECVPRKFKASLVGHECSTIPEAALSGFQLFITIDQGIEYQQNLTDRSIAIIVLRAKSSRLSDLVALVPVCLAKMQSIVPGELEIIGS